MYVCIYERERENERAREQESEREKDSECTVAQAVDLYYCTPITPRRAQAVLKLRTKNSIWVSRKIQGAKNLSCYLQPPRLSFSRKLELGVELERGLR